MGIPRALTIGSILVTCLLLVGACAESERPPPGLATRDPDPGGGGGGGGGGRGGGGGVRLDPSRSVTALTDEEADAFCGQVEQATTDAIGDPVEFACALVGLFAGGFAGGSVSVCEDARDACIANPSPDAQEGQFSCELGDPTARMDCDVTVGEARACFDDSLALFADNRDQFACAALASTEPATPLEDPASCAGLDTRCPVLFGDD